MAERVCPWWIGYILASPLRRFFQDPRKILKDYIKPGMKVVDVGCAMGFFSLELARLVGPNGRIVCIDVQDRMIRSLKRRAVRTGLSERIDPRVCSDRSLEIDDLTNQIDFALAFYVVHEVPDVPGLMAEVYRALKPGGMFFIAEPKGHATAEEYKATETLAQRAGFTIAGCPELKRSRTTLFTKRNEG